MKALYEAILRWHWEGQLAAAKAREAELEADLQRLREELGEAKRRQNRANIRLVAYARLA